MRAGEGVALSFFTTERIDSLLLRWSACPYFADHSAVLEAGLAAYREGRYIEAISVLVPRVEGVLTSVALKHDEKLTSLAYYKDRSAFVNRIAALASSEGIIRGSAVSRYTRYIEQHFFGKFDARTSPDSTVRHPLAHGAQRDFNQRRALQAILALDSAFYLIEKSGLQ